MSLETYPPSHRALAVNFADTGDGVAEAHGRCRRAERRICELLELEADPTLHSSLVSIRVIGHLLEYTLLPAAQALVAKDVRRDITIGMTEDAMVEKVVKLGVYYREYFIRIFRDVGKGRTPTQSRPSSGSFDLSRDLTRDFLLEPPRSYAVSKEQALIRDDYRDVITGVMDKPYYLDTWKPAHPGERLPGGAVHTKCCHIFTKSFNADASKDVKGQASATSWKIIRSFGFDNLLNELDGPGIHRLPNVMTLGADTHEDFDRMDLWLEETNVCHRYNIITPKSDMLLREELHIPSSVDFKAHGGMSEEMLPSPDYLRLHACACKVAHMAGVSGYFDALDDFYDDHGNGTIDTHFETLYAQLQILEQRTRDTEHSLDSEGDGDSVPHTGI